VQRNTANGAVRAEDKLVKMMNAMQYIGNKDARNARRWRIRHGTIDRDTSLAIPVISGNRLAEPRLCRGLCHALGSGPRRRL